MCGQLFKLDNHLRNHDEGFNFKFCSCFLYENVLKIVILTKVSEGRSSVFQSSNFGRRFQVQIFGKSATYSRGTARNDHTYLLTHANKLQLHKF